MIAVQLSAGPPAAAFARAVGRAVTSGPTPTPGPTASPVPTTTLPDATGGLGLAAALVALFFVGAIVVTAGGAAVAGWASVRGSLLTLEVGSRQRRLFALAAVCFALSLLALLGGVGPRLGKVFIAVFGVGGLAAAVGAGWVVTSNLRDWLRERE